MHARDIGNEPGRDEGVVSQPGGCADRKSNPRKPAANVQSGNDWLRDQGRVGLLNGECLATLLQIGIEQRETSECRLFEQFRRSEFNDVPLPHILLVGIFDSQFNGIPTGNRVRHRFQLIAHPSLPIAHHFAAGFIPRLLQNQHLQVTRNPAMYLAVSIEANHNLEIVPIIHGILTCNPEVARVLRLWWHFQQGILLCLDGGLKHLPLSHRVRLALRILRAQDVS